MTFLISFKVLPNFTPKSNSSFSVFSISSKEARKREGQKAKSGKKNRTEKTKGKIIEQKKKREEKDKA